MSSVRQGIRRAQPQVQNVRCEYLGSGQSSYRRVMMTDGHIDSVGQTEQDWVTVRVSKIQVEVIIMSMLSSIKIL